LAGNRTIIPWWTRDADLATHNSIVRRLERREIDELLVRTHKTKGGVIWKNERRNR
jgi:hypothetical protein